MTIYRIHPDRLNYQMLTIATEEVINKLGKECLFHIDSSPKSYTPIWKPLNIEFYNSTGSNKTLKLPDITINGGKVFLNKKAFGILETMLKNHGEFLPVTFYKNDGYIFNIFSLADDLDALNNKLCFMNEYGDLESLGFNQEKLNNLPIFRTAFDHFMGVFCQESFKELLMQSDLKGINFSPDISNIFPYDPTACEPTSH